MSGEIADINQLCKLAWYYWIIYRPSMSNYPDEPVNLGKYFGSAFDVGPAIAAKILQQNEEVVYRSTHRSLTIEEQADTSIQQDMIAFKESAEEHLGTKLTHRELEEVGIPDMP